MSGQFPLMKIAPRLGLGFGLGLGLGLGLGARKVTRLEKTRKNGKKSIA